MGLEARSEQAGRGHRDDVADVREIKPGRIEGGTQGLFGEGARVAREVALMALCIAGNFCGQHSYRIQHRQRDAGHHKRGQHDIGEAFFEKVLGAGGADVAGAHHGHLTAHLLYLF